MSPLPRIVGVACGLAVLSCIVACGSLRQSAARQKTSNDLKQLGLAYHNFIDANKKGPANSAEWLSKAGPEDAALIQQTGPGGKYTMFWGVQISKLPQGSNNTVLGHESTVPSQGGLVLMCDASVRQMTATEFAAAPKPPGDAK